MRPPSPSRTPSQATHPTCPSSFPPEPATAAEVPKELEPVRKPDYSRRVVVTGLGVVSPVGNDKDTAWRNLTEGNSGLGEITRFDSSPYDHHIDGEVKDFDPAAWMDAKAVRRSEREMHYGVSAAKQAVADSGF